MIFIDLIILIKRYKNIKLNLFINLLIFIKFKKYKKFNL